MNRRYPVRMLEKPVQYGRRDVVRQVSIYGKSSAAGQFCKINRKHIAFDYAHIVKGRSDFSQSRSKAAVELNREDFARTPCQTRRHFSVPGSDFDPYSFVDPNCVRDPFLPTAVGEEVLPQLLG
jgi:hypothetical protein